MSDRQFNLLVTLLKLIARMIWYSADTSKYRNGPRLTDFDAEIQKFQESEKMTRGWEHPPLF